MARPDAAVNPEFMGKTGKNSLVADEAGRQRPRIGAAHSADFASTQSRETRSVGAVGQARMIVVELSAMFQGRTVSDLITEPHDPLLGLLASLKFNVADYGCSAAVARAGVENSGSALRTIDNRAHE